MMRTEVVVRPRCGLVKRAGIRIAAGRRAHRAGRPAGPGRGEGECGVRLAPARAAPEVANAVCDVAAAGGLAGLLQPTADQFNELGTQRRQCAVSPPAPRRGAAPPRRRHHHECTLT